MANKVILDVEINDEAFDEFKRKFDQYNAALKTMPQHWQSANQQIGGQKSLFEKTYKALEDQGRSFVVAADSQDKFNKLLDGSALTWVSLSRSGKFFLGHVHHATQSLMRWSKLTAVFSGILGAGGLFGINRMAASVAGQRTSAMGLGVSYGEQASFLTNFGRLGNAEGILTGFSRVEAAVNKTPLRQYLGRDPSGDPAADFAAGLGKFKEFVDKTPHELLGPMLQARGDDQLGLGVEQANVIRRMSRAEVDQLAGSYRGDIASRLALSNADAKKWTNFTTQMERAGGEIQATFAKGAVQLTPSLTDLSDSFVKFADHMLVEGGPVAGLIKKFGKGIDSLAGTIDSGEFQASVRTFIRNCGDAVKLFESFAGAAPDLVGMAIAARVGGGAAMAAGTALAGSGALGGAGAAAAVAGATAWGMNKLMPQHPERLRRGQEYENAGGSPTSPHPAHTEHEKAIRRKFGYRPSSAHPTWDPRAGTPAPPGTPFNHRIGEPLPLEVIHGTTKGVDRRLLNAVASGAADLPPGYKVKVFSGFRSGDPGAHGRGQAIDVEIIDPKGNVIPSRGEDTTGMYRRLARYTYGEMKAKHPDLAEDKFAWGGSFGTQKGGGGVSDLMHFDIMRRRGGFVQAITRKCNRWGHCRFASAHCLIIPTSATILQQSAALRTP